MKSGKLSGTLAKRSDADKKLNRGGRHGIAEIIYKALIELRASSVAELAQFIWDSNESGLLSNFKSLEVFNRFVDKVLKKLYADGKITRLHFRTTKGRIFGLSVEDCWNYIFKNQLAPERLLRTFMRLLGSQGFVTNIELKEMGFTNYQIELWIEKKLAREGNYIKIHEVTHDIKVYCLPRYYGQLELYLKSDQFQEIYEKYCRKKEFCKSMGNYLEDIVEELFKKKGYHVYKHYMVRDKVYERTENGEFQEKETIVAEVDIFCYDPVNHEVVLIECKNESGIIGIGSLNKLLYLRNVKYKGNGKILLIDPFDNIGSSIWNSLKFYPYLRVWKSKDLEEECEKYQVETYLKLKEQFGSSTSIKSIMRALKKEYYVDGKVANWEEMQADKQKWYESQSKGDDS